MTRAAGPAPGPVARAAPPVRWRLRLCWWRRWRAGAAGAAAGVPADPRLDRDPRPRARATPSPRRDRSMPRSSPPTRRTRPPPPGALSTLAKTISTYERVWQADGGLEPGAGPPGPLPLRGGGPGVPAGGAALARRRRDRELGPAAVHPRGPPGRPTSRRPTRTGVGEAITMRAGVYVDLLSFFSAASGNAQPITPANAERVAQAQYKAMMQAPGGASSAARGSGRRLLQEDRLGWHHPGRRARGRRPRAGRGHTRLPAAAAPGARADDGALRRRRGSRSPRTRRVRSRATGGPSRCG